MENLLMRLLAVVNSWLVDETERVTATNLLKNIRKIPTCSIEQMAQICFVSPASLSRFCKRLGFRNYAYFRSLFESGLGEEEIFKPTYNAMTNDIVEFNTVQRVIAYHINALVALKEQIDYDVIDQVIQSIFEAEHIYLIGGEYLQPCISDFQLQMIRFNRFIEFLPSWLPSNETKENSIRILPKIQHIEGPKDNRRIAVQKVERRGKEKGKLVDIHISILEMSHYVSSQTHRFINEGKTGKKILECILEIIYAAYYEKYIKSLIDVE